MIRFTRIILLFTFISILGNVTQGQEWKKSHKKLLDTAISVAKSNPSFAIEQVNKAYDLAVSHGDHWKVSNSLSTMGYISNVNRDYATAFTNFTSALKELHKADTTDFANEMSIHQNLAYVYRRYKSYNEAIFHYEKSMESMAAYRRHHDSLFIAKGNMKFVVDIPYSAGIAHRDNGDYDKAGEIFINLWETSEFQRDTINLAKVLVQLGHIQKKAGSYQEAEYYYGLVTSSEGVSKSLRGIAYHNLGAMYLERELLDQAERYYNNALELKMVAGSKRSQFITRLDLGELYFKEGNINKAVEFWEAALEGYSKVGGEPDLYAVYNWLQLAYMDIDIEKAKEYNSLYASINSKWQADQQRQKAESSGSQLYALQNEINDIKADIERRDYAEDFVRTFWPFILGVIITVMLLLYLGNKLIISRRKARQLQKATQVLKENDTNLLG